MRPQLIMTCFGIFIIGTMLSMICSGVWFASNELTVINRLAGFSVVNIAALGGWGIPKSVLQFFDAIITMVSWSYPYLNNIVGLIIKLGILYPVTIGVIVTLIELAQSVIQGIAGTIRSLLPG